MIGYVTVGTNDLPRAITFYEKLLKPLNASRTWETDRGVGFSASPTGSGIGVCKPFNGEPATAGNGTMVALGAASEAQVQELYRLAIELGGKDEGAPGLRHEKFYAAYCRDLDGNKLSFFYMPQN
jgi:catechol 2,3-dioxygenase-like lactoylglutathione lyase family enzyme